MENQNGFGYAKALIFGEYAVMDGSPCLVVALSRRFEAECYPTPIKDADPQSQAIAKLLELSSACHFRFHHDAFYEDGVKLGIGSSAAMFVAALHAASKRETFGTYDDVMKAVQAHRTYQEKLGSGVDVIASMLGGVLLVKDCPQSPMICRLKPSVLPPFAILASHEAAPTKDFLLAAAAHQKDEAYLRSIAKLTELNRQFAAYLLARGDQTTSAAYRRTFLEHIEAYLPALDALQKALGRTILSESFEAVRKLAPKGRVAVKTSGAGGGDIMVAFALSEEELDAFCREAEEKCHVRRLSVEIAQERGNAALHDSVLEEHVERLRAYADAFEAESARMVLRTTAFCVLVTALGIFFVYTQWRFSVPAALLMVGFGILALLIGKLLIHQQQRRQIHAVTPHLEREGLYPWDLRRYVLAQSQTYPISAGIFRIN